MCFQILNFSFAETPEDLQISLDILQDYCQKWKLKVNIDKVKVMVLSKGGHFRQNLSFKYGNVGLEYVSKYTYMYLGYFLRLGVHLYFGMHHSSGHVVCLFCWVP